MNKKRIAYYLRNSTDQQDYIYQLDSLNSHLAQFNNIELVHIYAEKLSGFKLEKDRPEMKKLLDSVSNGEIDEIWVNEITRLSRDAINLQSIVSECEKFRVNIFFKNQSLNSLDEERRVNPVTRLIISILAQFAQMDVENLFSKSKQGKASKAKLGNYVGGTLPTGYTYINDINSKNKTIIIDEEQKKVVKYIFEEYVNKGKTLARICNELNNLKLIDPIYETPMKYKKKGIDSQKWKFHSWNPTTLKRILGCTWYAEGTRDWKGETVKIDNGLRFIDLNLYKRANEMLKSNQHGGQKRIYDYLLKHLLYCSCGEKMNPKNSSNRFNYKCNLQTLHDYDKSKKCLLGKSIEIEKLENAVWLLIKNKIPEFKKTVENKISKERRVKSKVEHNNELIRVIEDITIHDLREQRSRTIDVYTRFGGNLNDFEIKINEIDKKIKEQMIIKDELESENKRLLFSLQEQDIVAEIEYKINQIEIDKDQIKFYMNKLIRKVVACGGMSKTNKNLVEIHWKEGINNNIPTFLFYNSKLKLNPTYYFANSLNDDVQLVWDVENKSFIISDTNESIEFSLDNMFKKIDEMYDINKNKIRYINRRNKVLENVFMKDNTLPINIGCDRLIIVSPFIKKL